MNGRAGLRSNLGGLGAPTHDHRVSSNSTTALEDSPGVTSVEETTVSERLPFRREMRPILGLTGSHLLRATDRDRPGAGGSSSPSGGRVLRTGGGSFLVARARIIEVI